MKKLLAILLALTLALTLVPTLAYADDEDSENTQNETIYGPCSSCNRQRTQKIIGYTADAGFGTSDTVHFIIVKCLTCGKENTFRDGNPKYMYHTGGTEMPTCTTGKTCEKCGAEYGKLGHDWGAWQSNDDNKTHTRTCKREGCNTVDTAGCGGDDTATCVTLGTCADCGQQYYSGHTFPSGFKWASDTAIGRDAEKHWVRCLNCEEGKAHEGAHYFVQGNVYLKSAATCISNPVCYTNCAICDYKGTDTYVYQWGQPDPDNHDGGTEVKNAKAATCTEKGYTGDTYCKGCGVKLSDGTDIPSAGHNLKHVDAKRATTRAEGNIEYWYCDGCGKYFKDEAATKEITQADTVIAKKRRTNSDSTDSTGSTADKTVKSSQTGDPGVMLYVGLAAMSLTGGAWLRRKKH